MKRLFLIGLFLIAAPAAAEETIAPGKQAPAFSLKTLNPIKSQRKMLALRAHVGEGAEEPKKAVLLSFAASYCAPCKKEIKDLAVIEPALRKRGVLTAVVVIDKEEAGANEMKKLLVDEMGLELPVLSDKFAIVARRYGADKLPYVVLIDAGGTVRWVHAGYDPKALEKALAGL